MLPKLIFNSCKKILNFLNYKLQTIISLTLIVKMNNLVLHNMVVVLKYKSTDKELHNQETLNLEFLNMNKNN